MRGNVVLVPFPFDDLSATKVRPAVCLSDTVGSHRHVVLAFITSVIPGAPESTDVLIEPGTDDFERAGLRVRSAVRLHRLVSVSARLIQRRLGVLTPRLQKEIGERLRRLFAL